ncbi:MAG TPA: hypothetical protein VGQ59_00975 [Cyclobacteriaceae bacterium]|nr:hypothetical protein [Cyclobacteriaceae bacterium]
MAKDLILLFGTNEYLREKVSAVFPDIISDKRDVLTVRSGDSIIEFYYGSEEVIDKFVLVDVLFSDDPGSVLLKLCSENKWHLFDVEAETYVH